MTLFHFGNCLALVYVPYYLTYKYSGLSEYGAFWKCIQAGGIYAITQLCKMLILATFFPTAETSIHGEYDIFGEICKSTVDLADLVGMYVVLSSIPGKGHAKLLTTGVGWAGAEAALTRCVLLWVGAKGAEFNWKYILKCLESNVSLVQSITTGALVWLWSRHDLSKPSTPVVTVMLLLSSYKPLIIESLAAPTLGPWCLILLKAAYTLALSTATLKIYAGHAETIGIY